MTEFHCLEGKGWLDDRVPLSMGKGLEDREIHRLRVRVLDDGELHCLEVRGELDDRVPLSRGNGVG